MMKIFYLIAVPLLLAGVLSHLSAGAKDFTLDHGNSLVNERAVRVNNVAVRVNDVAVRVNDVAVRVNDVAVRVNDVTVRIKDITVRKRTGYRASRTSRSARTSRSYRASKLARSGRSARTGSIAKNALHKETKHYTTTGDLRAQRGSLPWPVDSRKVSMHFGLQSYGANDNVKIDNLGIVIDGEKDAPVKAVMDGVVDDVMDIGDGVAILVKHGTYFFIYSDLAKACVTRGQQVTTGELLGQLGETGQLDFRVYDAGDIWLDPEKWLAR